MLCSNGDSPGDGVARPSVNRRKSHGLVAEEVQTVNPDLVARDRDGKPFTVRYDAVNAMLLSEFLKEHCKVEQLTKDFESQPVEQQKQIEALTAGLQKVSNQLEVCKPRRKSSLTSREADYRWHVTAFDPPRCRLSGRRLWSEM